MRILAIVGSLRAGSINRQLLQACIEAKPDGMTIEEAAIGGVPLYNADVEAQGDPEAVTSLKQAVAAADGLLIVTPEYNASIPGVLKNAVDWLSRPAGKSVLSGKPGGILGAAPGQLGTARSQAHLRLSLEFNNVAVMPMPQVYVGLSREKFDADGRLTDEKTRAILAKYMSALAVWVGRFKA